MMLTVLTVEVTRAVILLACWNCNCNLCDISGTYCNNFHCSTRKPTGKVLI